jgi:small-conductance mechanosensitive channel
VEAAEAVLSRARARLVLLHFQRQRDASALPPSLAATPILARLAELREEREDLLQVRSRLQAQLDARPQTRELTEILQERAKVIDASLALLTSVEGDLQATLDLVEVAERLLELRSERRPPWVAWGLTGVLLGIVFSLLRFGHRRLLAWETPARWLAAHLRLGPRGRLRAGLAISLIYTVALLLLGGWLILRLAWGIRVDSALLGRVLSHPLFVIDDRPVSGISILQLVLVVVAALTFSRWVRHFFQERVYPVLDWDTGLTTALDTLLHYLFLLAGFLLGLRFVGIGLSSLALFAGVLGIGIGFGMRNVAENFISGLIILAERPIKIGDFIELEGRYEGRVADIEARATTVVTRDNVSVIIPNSEFIGRRVTNWSYGDPKVRLRVRVGVAYGSDVDRVRKVLLEVASRHGKILKRPPPEVWFQDFGASSLDFDLLFWIDDQASRFRIASDLRFAIDKAFRKHGIEIAFPQLDLHVRDLPQRTPALDAHPDPGSAPEA